MRRYHDDVAALARPLHDAAGLDALIDRAAGARVVILGEASHGTRDYYTWRATVTKRLIEEHGFSFVAVEGDWPDCARVDRSVRGRDGAPGDPREALLEYRRWPTWMWANEEVAGFCRWLRAHNDRRDPAGRVGFHGLDVYSLWESLREILVYLREHDPDRVDSALAAYRCFEPHDENPNAYAWSTRFIASSCESDVVRLLTALRERRISADADFDTRQNAEIVAGAEHYYRALVHGGPLSWNIRDRHMDETLQRLLDHYEDQHQDQAPGGRTRGVVWAHNTHIGDARGTDQSRHGEVTIGELARHRFGADDVLLVGFGGHRGTVVAAETWGGATEEMTSPPARHDSLEDVWHDAAPPCALSVFPPPAERTGVLAAELVQRAIGVVYRPDRENWGNYVPTVLGERYDAFLWFDETRALTPLHTRMVDILEPETYPSGV